jgi:hypothetical protein
MFEQALASVFANAAIPQKIVLLVLMGAVPVTLVAAALASRKDARGEPWRRVLADLRWTGPSLGLLVGALNAFHMGQTIQRVPFEPTAKQLAPGVLEVSTLVGLGALVGIVAAAAHLFVAVTVSRDDAP